MCVKWNECSFDELDDGENKGYITDQPGPAKPIAEENKENYTTMGIDTDLVAVLQDLVQFLESLADVNLPQGLQDVRNNLLRRSRTSLVIVGQRSTTPEPYLDMNAGKNNVLNAVETMDPDKVIDDNQITEYMYADNSNQSRFPLSQDYYESFATDVAMSSGENIIKREWNKADEELKTIYQTFSFEQTTSKASKSGPLNLKEERRLFGFQLFGGFEQFRSCYIGLVGTHLLLYATKHEKHPNDIVSIRGYSARASPNVIPRDSVRSKSSFEIFSPGYRTLQFIARSPKEMEQWVAIICRAGNVSTSFTKSKSNMTKPMIIDKITESSFPKDSTCSEEQYQDVGCINERKCRSGIITNDDINNDNVDRVTLRNEEKCTIFTSNDGLVHPPPLPARIPRRLPSLPHEQQSLKLDSVDAGYDEDDIYHKIEDIKQLVCTYQNVTTANHISKIDNDRTEPKRKGKKSTKKKSKNNKEIYSPPDEFYDDAQPAGVSKLNRAEMNKIAITYDDIQSIINDARNEIVKETRKKSFLDRVRYRKESSKEDAKKKIKQQKLTLNKNIILSQCQPSHELPPYDDVGLEINIQQNDKDNMGDYTCPPAPRLIHVKPESVVVLGDHNEEEDCYDDIGVFQSNRGDKFLNNPSQVSTFKPSCLINNDISSGLAMHSLPVTTKMANSQDECEHYQVPRSQDPIDIEGQVGVEAPMTDELYDEIAIVANFRARQSDSACSNSSSKDGMPIATTNVVRVWNRFASSRKLKTCDLPLVDRNERPNSDECVNTTTMKLNSNEEIDGLKMNKLQKLIIKMESSLSKSKPIPAINHKSHDENYN